MDKFGNINASEGCDRCAFCGSKYWENDNCATCGLSFERSYLRIAAQRAMCLIEIRRNVMWTTLCHDLGIEAVHGLDLADTMNKYRKMGVIE